MNEIQNLQSKLSTLAIAYLQTGCRKKREILATEYEEFKSIINRLLISKCCGAQILLIHNKSKTGICDECRNDCEPIEPVSNCCGSEIQMMDSNHHGKCKECGENCTP